MTYPYIHILVAALLLSATARAAVTEPNGQIVPGPSSAPGETSLQTFFMQRGEAIDWIQDAHTTPATFSPLCGFTATFVLNEAGERHGLGWYNVVAGAMQPPTLAQIYPIIQAGAAVGTMFSGTDIINDSNYLGGDIGFVLTGGQLHYSEEQWNVSCDSCNPRAPWILSLTYKSTTTPNAYYLGFEDGSVDLGSFNNDGDFNDDVFFLTGIACTGSGAPCDTGMPGVCQAGLTECAASGMLVCRQQSQSGTEVCDGVDNDCNLAIDDGAMCPGNKICDRGRCVDPCGAVEFPCEDPLVCDRGVCIESACVGQMCPAGQVCHGGQCRGLCDGVVCPQGQVCRLDRCVDPCVGVVCGMGKVCQGGVCITACDCQPCGAGQSCVAQTGLCVEAACVGVSCPGQVCQGGLCVDACTGVSCPPGQLCTGGACVDAPPPADMAMTPPDLAVADASVAPADGSATPDRGNMRGLDSGCGCRQGAHAETPIGVVLAFLLLGLALVRRRFS